MPIGLLGALSIGASVVGGVVQSRAARSAANAQTTAAQNQIELQREMFDETTENFAPFLEGGRRGYDAYLFEMGLGERPNVGAGADGSGGAPFRGFQASPSFDFQRRTGLDAIQSTAAARGGLMSGATMQAAQTFGNDLGNMEFSNYLNRLAGIGQSGQAAAGNQANSAANFATNAGNSLGAMGNAQAAGAIGQGNAFSGALNNLSGTFGAFQGQGMFGAQPQAQQAPPRNPFFG